MQGLLPYAHITCLVTLAALAIITFYLCRNSHSRTHFGELFLAALCPTAAYIVELFFHMPYQLTPFGLIAGLLLSMHFIFITRSDEVSETARDYTFSFLEDPLVVLDSAGTCRDFNKQAELLFPELQHIIPNGSGKLPSDLKYILEHKDSGDITRNGRVYEATHRTIGSNHNSSCVIWFSDVTEQRSQSALLADYQRNLESSIREKSATIQRMQTQMIINFANIVESRDLITGGHIKRTSRYVRILIDALIAHNVFPELNDPAYAEHICLAAPLHDIGKIAIPDSILNKTSIYTHEEFEIMKSHTWLGGQILDKTMSMMVERSYYWLARNMTVYHHERWDGKGYPKCLSGNDIPLCARVMAVADVFDALTSQRPYKEAITIPEAIDIIRSKSGNHFDPLIADIFVTLEDKLQSQFFIH